MRKYLNYAKAYLENELEIIDSPTIEVRVDGDCVWIDNPKFQQGVHNNTYYMANIRHDLQELNDLLGGGGALDCN